MTPVPAPANVLISGVNGYLGMWTVRKYLEAGYAVRGQVRSMAKSGKHIRQTFASHGDKFELVEVPDITAPGAFDKVVNGIDVVVHTAAPFHMNAKAPEEMIDPALKGTVSILESIHKNAPSVKRVVLTSSVVAIWELGHSGTKEFNETMWNHQAVDLVQAKGDDADPAMFYGAAKTLAERAAWEFREKNNCSWDLAVINPPYLYGPPIHEVHSAGTLNTSQKRLFDILTGGYDDEKIASDSGSAVDVRDVANAHVLAAHIPEAGNERVLVSEGDYWTQEILDIANSIDPPVYDKLSKGKPGSAKGKTPPIKFNTSKFQKLYGYKHIPLKETIKDSLEDFQARGWLP